MNFTITRVLGLLWLAVLLAAGAAHAASPSAPSAAPSVPADLTRDGARDLVSKMDDRQARSLLLQRLTEDADRREAERKAADTELADLPLKYTSAFAAFLGDVLAKAPRIPSEIAGAFDRFVAERADRPASTLALTLAVSVLAGLAALALVRWMLPNVVGGHPASWPAMGRLGFILAQMTAFALLAHGTNFWLNAGTPADRLAVRWIVAIGAWSALGIMTLLALLSPRRPAERILTIDDAHASRLTAWLIPAVLTFNIGFGFAAWLTRFGSPFNATWIGFWFNLLFHGLLLSAVWTGRRGISQIAAGTTDAAELSSSRLARWWPTIVLALIATHWLVVELIVATSDVPVGLFASMAITLATIVALPILDQALKGFIWRLVPDRGTDQPALAAADTATRIGALRVGRIAAATLLVVILLKLWRVDLWTLAEQGVGSRLASAVLNSLLILGLAYGLWQLVRIVTDRHIAFERVALGLDKKRDDETEGGGAGARLGTLLPLARVTTQIAIAVLAGFAILSELGINVWPLIAGAGVVGIAIGFGAQTLVKDILSGFFFLIDDAFRMGEYIDVGGTKGTVERISLRSMQLRHHNGPLNTVPFGDIKHVTNFSRDWVVMKFTLRLTYDTDGEKVRKMIKKLGQELLEHPEHGPKFLQPLKSQGVIEMDDSAMLMRIKFMTKPGDQWVIRRVVLNRIRDMFEQSGIRFASREVVVRVSDSTGATRIDPQTLGAAALAQGEPAPVTNLADKR